MNLILAWFGIGIDIGMIIGVVLWWYERRKG